jgi:2-iminobutanoate/2-iminopropanoate deaminase
VIKEVITIKKILINPEGIAAPISKYSHCVRVEIGDAALIFVSGQIALDPEGNVIGTGDVLAQTEYVFKEIDTIVKASGASLKDVVKATIFVTNMANFPKVAEVRNRYFAESPPACTFVEVNKLVRDGCLVEIEVIAAVSKS